MTGFLSFFIVLLSAVFFSALFNRLHLPWVAALIIAGIVIGPSGLGVFEPDATMNFLGDIGLVFLMFIVGLEIKLSGFKEYKKGVGIMTIFTGLLPFISGVLVGYGFGYNLTTSLLLGIIFLSTSIAIVVPSLEKSGLITSKIGKLVVSTTMIEDIASLIFLSILLQIVRPSTDIPLPLFYAVLAFVLYFIRLFINQVHKLFTTKRFLIFKKPTTDLFQQELRIVFTLLIGTVILFELLGLHPIIAGFFAGLILSEYIESQLLIEKIRTVSYGLFIPIFFITIGTKTNIFVFSHDANTLALFLVILVISFSSKFIGGFLGARTNGFSRRESLVVGSAELPRLSTTLAVASTGFEYGIIDQTLVTIFILLSVISSLIGPMLINYFSSKVNA